MAILLLICVTETSTKGRLHLPYGQRASGQRGHRQHAGGLGILQPRVQRRPLLGRACRGPLCCIRLLQRQQAALRTSASHCQPARGSEAPTAAGGSCGAAKRRVHAGCGGGCGEWEARRVHGGVPSSAAASDVLVRMVAWAVTIGLLTQALEARKRQGKNSKLPRWLSSIGHHKIRLHVTPFCARRLSTAAQWASPVLLRRHPAQVHCPVRLGAPPHCCQAATDQMVLQPHLPLTAGPW